jgi:hypothetical protein
MLSRRFAAGEHAAGGHAFPAWRGCRREVNGRVGPCPATACSPGLEARESMARERAIPPPIDTTYGVHGTGSTCPTYRSLIRFAYSPPYEHNLRSTRSRYHIDRRHAS